MKKLLLFIFLLPLLVNGQAANRLPKLSSGDSSFYYDKNIGVFIGPSATSTGGGIPTAIPLPATTGTITLGFDKNYLYQDATQTGNISLSSATSGLVPGAWNEVTIKGDTTHSLSFPAGWVPYNGVTFDNKKLNDIFIEYKNNGRWIYNIVKSPLPTAPDVTPPTYSVQTVTPVFSTTATFNVQINESGNVKWMVTTSSTPPSKTAIGSGTGAAASNFGTLTLSPSVTNTASITGLSPSTNYYLYSYAIDASLNQTAVQTLISFTTTTADVTPPSLVSAATNVVGDQIVLTYSETLGSVTPATSDYSLNLSRTVTGVTVSGSTVTLNISSIYSNTDVIACSYTRGTNKIQDVAGNFAVNFTNFSVSNSVVTNGHAVGISAANQIVSSSGIPTTLQFGNGTSETPFSFSGWVKVSSATTQQFMVYIGDNATFGIFLSVLSTTGHMSCLISSPTGGISIVGSTALSNGSWNHVAWTYTAATRTIADFHLYINGTEETSITDASFGSYTGKQTYPSGTRLYVLGDPAGNPSTGIKVDEQYWFNSALTSSQVTNIYHGGVVENPSLFPVAPIEGWRYENNLNSFGSGFNLTSTSPPTYSTDHP
jgi:hypothetical protein